MVYAQIMKPKDTDKHNTLNASGAFSLAVKNSWQINLREESWVFAQGLKRHQSIMVGDAWQEEQVHLWLWKLVAGHAGHLNRQDVKRVPAETQN